MAIFDFFPILFKGVQYTLIVTFCAFAIGVIIAIPVTYARRSKHKALRALGTAYVEIVRGIPPLPWLFIVFFGLPSVGIKLPPVESGILVFGVVAGAYLTEIYRAGFRALPSGQLEAGDALGLSRAQTYIKVLIPQAVPTMLPLAIAYLIGLLKDSAIVSIVGVQDIAAIALVENRQSGQGLIVFVAAALLYLALSVPIGIFGRWLGERLSGKKKRVEKASTLTEAVKLS